MATAPQATAGLRRRSTGSIDVEVDSITDVRHAQGQCSQSHVIIAFVVDVAMWALLFFREYGMDTMYNCTISHFVVVLPMSDVFSCFISRSLWHWVDVFRIFGALQVLALTVQLLMNGVDGSNHLLSGLRIVFALLRVAHGISGVRAGFRLSDPTQSSLHGKLVPKLLTTAKGNTQKLFLLCETTPGPQNKYAEFIQAFFFATWAATVRSTHNMFGEMRVEGPLTSFQAADALNFFVKLFFYDRLVSASTADARRGMRLRGVCYLFMALVLLLQWPWMWKMFSEAPLPYIHIFAEIGLLQNAHRRLTWRFTPRRSEGR